MKKIGAFLLVMVVALVVEARATELKIMGYDMTKDEKEMLVAHIDATNQGSEIKEFAIFIFETETKKIKKITIVIKGVSNFTEFYYADPKKDTLISLASQALRVRWGEEVSEHISSQLAGKEFSINPLYSIGRSEYLLTISINSKIIGVIKVGSSLFYDDITGKRNIRYKSLYDAIGE